jgi:hypothetical protein
MLGLFRTRFFLPTNVFRGLAFWLRVDLVPESPLSLAIFDNSEDASTSSAMDWLLHRLLGPAPDEPLFCPTAQAKFRYIETR